MLNTTISHGDAEAHVIKKNGNNGLVTYGHELYDYERKTVFIQNATYGINMAVDAALTGTPLNIHDGTDNSYWTASVTNGPSSKFDFASTDRAYSGTKSIKANKVNVGGSFQVANTGTIATSGYQTVSMYVNVDKNWAANDGDSFELYGYNTSTSSQIGDAVNIQDYFNELDFDTWQKLNIPLSNLNLSASTIDAFRVECVSKVNGPTFYIDEWQLEASANGESVVEFKGGAPLGTEFLVDSIRFYFVDALDTSLVNNSMPNLSYDKFLGLPALTNGITMQRIEEGEIKFSVNAKKMWDLIKGGAYIKNVISDGTNTGLVLELNFDEEAVIRSKDGDYISISISDDLSPLIEFTSEMSGKIRNIEPSSL